MGYLIPFISAALGIGVLSYFKEVILPLPMWQGVVIAFAIFWLSFTAGMALVATRRPTMVVDDLQYDELSTDDRELRGVFFIRITNGEIPLSPTVLITEVCGGNRPIEHGHHAHWRGKPREMSERDRILGPGMPQQFGLLGIGRHPSGNPGLFIWDRDWQMHFIAPDDPLNRQGTVRIRVTIIGEAESGDDKKDRTILNRVYYIAPDASPTSKALYRIVEQPPQ